MIVISDGNTTFLIFSYGYLNWGSRLMAGIFTRDSRFILPGSGTESILKLSTTSNVGYSGMYIYRVDQNYIISPNFTSTSKC